MLNVITRKLKKKTFLKTLKRDVFMGTVAKAGEVREWAEGRGWWYHLWMGENTGSK